MGGTNGKQLICCGEINPTTKKKNKDTGNIMPLSGADNKANITDSNLTRTNRATFNTSNIGNNDLSLIQNPKISSKETSSTIKDLKPDTNKDLDQFNMHKSKINDKSWEEQKREEISKSSNIISEINYNNPKESLQEKLDVIYIFDISGSMSQKIKDIAHSVGNKTRFIEKFANEKRITLGQTLVIDMNAYFISKKILSNVGLISFNSSVFEVVPLSRSSSAIFTSVSSLKTGGKTAIYDAITFAMKKFKLKGSKNAKIVIITDGEENASKQENIDKFDYLHETFGLKDTLKSCILDVNVTNDKSKKKKIKEFYKKLGEKINASYYDMSSQDSEFVMEDIINTLVAPPVHLNNNNNDINNNNLNFIQINEQSQKNKEINEKEQFDNNNNQLNIDRKLKQLFDNISERSLEAEDKASGKSSNIGQQEKLNKYKDDDNDDNIKFIAYIEDDIEKRFDLLDDIFNIKPINEPKWKDHRYVVKNTVTNTKSQFFIDECSTNGNFTNINDDDACDDDDNCYWKVETEDTLTGAFLCKVQVKKFVTRDPNGLKDTEHMFGLMASKCDNFLNKCLLMSSKGKLVLPVAKVSEKSLGNSWKQDDCLILQRDKQNKIYFGMNEAKNLTYSGDIFKGPVKVIMSFLNKSRSENKLDEFTLIHLSTE